MELEELLSLDVRLLIPYLSRDEDRTRQMGIVYREGEDLKMTKIRNGWPILNDIRRQKYGDIFKFPAFGVEEQEKVGESFLRGIGETEVFKGRDFKKIAKRFVEHYVFDRDAPMVSNAHSYLRIKNGGPENIRCFNHRKKLKAPVEFAKLETERLFGEIENSPELIGLQDESFEFFKEVRLSNPLSGCVINAQQYGLMLEGCDVGNVSLTNIDFVAYSSDADIYFVEVKFSKGRHIKKSRRRARAQLTKQGMFFERNFGVSPRLVHVELVARDGEWELTNRHYRLDGMELVVS